jgi:hypothetical protein
MREVTVKFLENQPFLFRDAKKYFPTSVGIFLVASLKRSKGDK